MMDEQDELIDATIDKMEQAGAFDEPERIIKQTVLHGFPVKLRRRVSDGTVFIGADIERQPDSITGGTDHTREDSAGFWREPSETEQQTVERALAWADNRAFGLYAMKLALFAVSTDPHYVASPKESEPWVGLARTVAHHHNAKPGLYVADLSDDLVSPEVGPCKGGKVTVHSEPGDFEIRETTINCELVWSMPVAGKWLAVYEVSEAA